MMVPLILLHRTLAGGLRRAPPRFREAHSEVQPAEMALRFRPRYQCRNFSHMCSIAATGGWCDDATSRRTWTWLGDRSAARRIARRNRASAGPPVESADWLNLDGDRVHVELTSEDSDWPIEGALLNHLTGGWRAAAA